MAGYDYSVVGLGPDRSWIVAASSVEWNNFVGANSVGWDGFAGVHFDAALFSGSKNTRDSWPGDRDRS